MSSLLIRGNSLFLNGVEYKRENLYSEDFLKYSDNKADKLYIDHYCVNEMFVYYVQRYLTLEYFIENNSPVDEIVFDNPSIDLMFYAKHIAKTHNIRCKNTGSIKSSFLRCQSLLYNFAIFVYLIYKMFIIRGTNEHFEDADNITVLRKRSKQSIQRFKKFDYIHKEMEDINSKDSIYRLFSRMSRIGWVFRGYVKSVRDFKMISKFYEPLVGKGTVSLMYQWYGKRAIHTELFSELLDNYLSHFKGKTYYTGSNLDRFSVVEEKIAAKNNMKTICIPHGLEYGYKFPKGFSCEFCYTTGKEASTHLNTLYNTDKFKWDEDVANKMFKLDNTKPHPRMVVFFTEPRDIYVHIRIIEELIPKLKEIGVKLFLKFHPADNPDNYKRLNLEVITDYNMSLTNNICIARKSTTLLEAAYNGSVPIAIITNSLDQNFFNTFPSLQTDTIIKTYSVSELFDAIKANLA